MLAHTPGTEFDALLKDPNPALRTAIESAAPQLVALTEASKLFTKSAGKLEATPPDALDADRLADALVAGTPLPVDLTSQLTQQAVFETSLRTTMTLLAGIGGVLAGRIIQSTIGAADAIRHDLHQQLSRCLGKVAELPDGFARNPAAAIAGRRVEQYERARTLLDEHHAIREAQMKINSKVPLQDTALGPVRPADVLFRTPDAAYDEWVAWQRFGYLVDQYGRQHPLTPPWPTDITSDDFALWCAANPEAGPWVPTRQQFADYQHRIAPLISSNHSRRSTRMAAPASEDLVMRMPDNTPRRTTR